MTTSDTPRLSFVEEWRVVDLWWKEREEQIERFFLVLEAPDGDRACVEYDARERQWKIVEGGGSTA